MDKLKVKVAQVNTHHARGASAAISRVFARTNLGVVLIQEPWVNRGQIRGLPNGEGKVIWDVRCDNPRACILIRNNISYICLSEFMTRDLVPVRAKIRTGHSLLDVVIASGYFAGDGQAPPEEVQRLSDYCIRSNLPLLLGCDANAHNTIWGSTDTNQRGEQVLEFILAANLNVLNVGCVPTFVTRARQEVLDLTLGSPSISRMVRNWRVSDEPSLSDHRIIMFNVEGLVTQTTFTRNPRNTDWEKYTTNLRCNLEQIKFNGNSHVEFEQTLEALNGAIMDAYESSCPIKEKKSHSGTIWWNEHLSNLRSEVRWLFNKAKRDGDWQGYTERLTKYNKEIRKAKRNSFRSFCETITSSPAAARLHKTMARGREQGPMSLRRTDGSYTEDEEQRALLLLETHFPGSIPFEPDRSLEEPGRVRRENWEVARTICTPQRVKWAIDSFQPFKSPGIDGIFPALLQKGQTELLPFIIKVARFSLALGYIPSNWRRARVTFIPKVGKKDPTLPKSFRPICLSSFLLKTLEKMVDNYIRTEILERVPLHPGQHAYRAGRSTETALYVLTESIQRSLEHKEMAICAFLDIEGAFDNTSHEAINRALTNKGVDSTTSRWMCQMLATRTAETKVGDISFRISTNRGCPQGGVLSPLMWSLVVDELLGTLTGNGVTCLGYADDIVIMAKGKFEGTLCDLIERELETTRRWCLSVGLRINSSKTTVVPFTRRTKFQHLRTVRLDGADLEWQQEVKYLGLTLDSKLLWNRHVEKIVNKAKSSLMMCRNIAGKTWGCNPSILRWMYTMIVRPMITYGAVVWHGRTELATTKKILEKVQRLACLCITGAMRSTPTAAIEVILDLTPLHIMVRRTAWGANLRLAKVGLKGTAHSVRGSTPTVSAHLTDLPTDEITRKFSFEKRFRTELNTKREWSTESIRALGKNTITWYTDGSKTPDGTGAGVFGPRTKYSESMGQFPSIFQAEIHAIERCIQFNLDRKYRNKEIAILSDSQAAIKALSSYNINSKMVWECLDKLNDLGRNNKVILLWVPGHVGVEGNEQADTLARKGASKPLIGPEPFCGLGKSYFQEELNKTEEAMRATYWQRLPGLRQAKDLLGNFNRARSKTLINLSKTSLKTITGFLTGHCRLKEHLRKLGLEEDSTCRFCGEHPETPHHILMECYAVHQKRLNILGSHQLTVGEIPRIDPLKILKFLKELRLEGLL